MKNTKMKVRCRLVKKKTSFVSMENNITKKDIFGFVKAINTGAIDRLSNQDIDRLKKVLKNIK